MIGNPVQIGSGPAAVTGDQSRDNATGNNAGKARQLGRSGSQKTNLPKHQTGHPGEWIGAVN